jgi:hypothetical protein
MDKDDGTDTVGDLFMETVMAKASLTLQVSFPVPRSART